MSNDQPNYEYLQKHLDRLEVKIDALTSIIIKMAQVEERVSGLITNINHLTASKERLETRVSTLETQAPTNHRTSTTLDKVMYAVLTAAIAILGSIYFGN